MSLVDDTVVEVAGSVRGPTIMELHREYEQQDALPYALTYSPDSKRVVLGAIVRVWVAGQTRSIFEVETASGIKVRTTHDHPFMLADGNFRHASHLKMGDVLRAIDNTSRATMLDKVVKASSVYLSGLMKDNFNVYDMEIDNHHTFAISNVGTHSPIALVVHNSPR